MGRLQGKTALVTGATKSIGFAIAEAFCREGAQVIITGRLPREQGLEKAKAIGAADYLCLDVTQEDDWHQAHAYIEKHYQTLDILVNNAGIDTAPGSKTPQDIESISLKDWHAVLAVNLDGLFLGCKAMLPLLKQSDNASIINLGSRSGRVGVPSNIAYGASKGASDNFTKTLALHCAKKGYKIRCNEIVPAAILTDMWDLEFGHDEHRQQRITEYSQSIPLKRMGKAEEVAQMAVFLASDESSYVTSAPFLIDGGIMASAASYASNPSPLNTKPSTSDTKSPLLANTVFKPSHVWNEEASKNAAMGCSIQ
ncbi:SDR family oxidoreductase [Legionella sp. MW5194]|uniref:SDR family NAD(P)-dependent oxidoreductase n=1 Tax=Legionella sp. MW5194 TaxID=2662448 RepID=UPI00193E132A|nr:SDR family oxidoreductase [Legionella sp. MW5194]QRN04548.1 SDR family oxidoreductase [Legionella sp. MW5194]